MLEAFEVIKHSRIRRPGAKQTFEEFYQQEIAYASRKTNAFDPKCSHFNVFFNDLEHFQNAKEAR